MEGLPGTLIAKKTLKESRKHDPELNHVYNKLLQDVFFRLGAAMDAFSRGSLPGEGHTSLSVECGVLQDGSLDVEVTQASQVA